MMIAPEIAMALAAAVPLIGFVAIWLLDRAPNLREAATLITGAVLVVLTGIVFVNVGAGGRPAFAGFEVVDGILIAFRAEPLGALFALVASALWFINSIYSIGYMRAGDEKHQTRFYMCFALSISATMGLAYAANLFTLFVFYEVLTLATYPLVAHKGDDAARKGGRVYLGVLLATSIGLFLPAIVWTYNLAGSTDFVPGGLLAPHAIEAAPHAAILLALFAFGVGKAALMPAHLWLPAAMVAPTPVSAFLHAVAVVKAGVFTILKIAIYIFGPEFLSSTDASEPLIWIAGGSILLASAIAMNKDNLKARLAYSTVSQLAYVTLGAMLATSMGVIGGAYHIAAHAFAKITLFMCAGAIYVAAHKSLVSELNGLGRVMPVTFGAFFIAALSIVGLPPTGGSWSKFFLMLGAADAGELAIIGALVVSAILNIIYLVSIPVAAFYLSPAPAGRKAEGARGAAIEWRNLMEAPLLCLAPLALTALAAVLIFFFVDPLYAYLAPILEKR